jgi:hypothetical protein
MRRPLDWFVIALSLAFLLAGRSLQRPAAAASRVDVEPTVAALPAARHAQTNLEFGYISLEAANDPQRTH